MPLQRCSPGSWLRGFGQAVSSPSFRASARQRYYAEPIYGNGAHDQGASAETVALASLRPGSGGAGGSVTWGVLTEGSRHRRLHHNDVRSDRVYIGQTQLVILNWSFSPPGFHPAQILKQTSVDLWTEEPYRT